MSFLELYKNKQLGSEYILVIPKGTMEYKEDASGTGRKFPKKKTTEIQKYPIQGPGTLRNKSVNLLSKFTVEEPDAFITTEYVRIFDLKLPEYSFQNNHYYKASDINVEKITPTSADKARKQDVLDEFRNVVEVAEVEPPETSNYPFSSRKYHEAQNNFRKQQTQHFLHKKGKTPNRRNSIGGRRTRRQRRKSKK